MYRSLRFSSNTASIRRLADSWGEIHIPSPKEVKTASLAARLASKRPKPPAANWANAKPGLTPTTPKGTPFPIRVSSRIDSSLQSAADVFDDLIPERPSSQNDSWNKGLENIKKTHSRVPSGQIWTPKSGAKTVGPRKRDSPVVQKPVKEYDENRAIIEATTDTTEHEQDGISVEFVDETSVRGVSLIAPEPGQSIQMWYEKIIEQNREPIGPHALTPDVEISPDMHDLFGIDHANPQIFKPVALQDRPAIQKSKVDYQYRRALQRAGGDYSRIQPTFVPTDLRKLRPSQLAKLAISRRPEASTSQRTKFASVLSSTLRDMDKVSIVKSSTK